MTAGKCTGVTLPVKNWTEEEPRRTEEGNIKVSLIWDNWNKVLYCMLEIAVWQWSVKILTLIEINIYYLPLLLCIYWTITDTAIDDLRKMNSSAYTKVSYKLNAQKLYKCWRKHCFVLRILQAKSVCCISSKCFVLTHSILMVFGCCRQRKQAVKLH